MSVDSICKKSEVTILMNEELIPPTIGTTVKISQSVTESEFTNPSTDFFFTESTLPDIATMIVNTPRCYEVVVSCFKPTSFNPTLITSVLLMLTTTTMPPELTTGTNSTVTNYDDNFNFSEDYTTLTFDSSTSSTDRNWMESTTDSIVNITADNEKRRFKRDYEYDYDDDDDSNDPPLSNDGIKETNFFNAMSEFYAKFQDETNSTTISYENISDMYSTITTIIDSITSTSDSTDYERKCWLNMSNVSM